MFYLRINKIKILNNREMLGKGEVQLMSFINTGDTDFPMLEQFFYETEEGEQKNLISQAVEQVLSSRIMTPVHKVKDNHNLIFGDAGYVIYQSEKIPQDINWMLIAIELDNRTRDNEVLLETILTNENISTLTNTVAKLAGLANPAALAVIEITTFATSTLTKLFKNDKNDQVGLFMTFFNRIKHYPYGIRDKQNAPDLTGNIFVDYSIFGFE